jgi:hypothetical protein
MANNTVKTNAHATAARHRMGANRSSVVASTSIRTSTLDSGRAAGNSYRTRRPSHHNTPVAAGPFALPDVAFEAGNDRFAEESLPAAANRIA